jgi:outer membrane protein assembly factor BamE (lipoprotein component of BamABCDE complex)
LRGKVKGKAMNFVKSTLSIGLLAAAAFLAPGCTTTSTSTAQMSDKQFAAVKEGMTTDEVRSTLGAPKRTMAFPKSDKVAWDYEGTDTWGYMVEYSVTFSPDGRVVSKLARRLNDGGERK